MPRSLISLGANLGNVRETMRSANRLLLESFPNGRLTFSRLYRTPPVGGPSGQADFLNAVVSLETTHSVWEVWEAIKRIELELGRQRQHRWEARRIDIDVLLHDSDRVWTPHFKVPHPRMCMRSFILKPALEVAEDWIDPVSGWTIRALYDHLSVDRPTLVTTPSLQLRDELQSALAPELSRQLTWQVCSSSTSSEAIRATFRGFKLIIVAVSTPDPETILWEDYSRCWAQFLGMDSSSKVEAESQMGPRYLLPANDRKWAAHEIAAATEAMTCPVELADDQDHANDVRHRMH